MKFLLILLLGPLPAWCQLPVLPLQTISASGVPGPNSISGIRYWWVSSDMAVGVTVSNQWADRIVGNLAKQDASASQPTNAALGVRFNGSPVFLTNSTPFTFVINSTTGSVFVVFRPETPAGSIGGIICSDSTSGVGLYSTSGNTLRPFGDSGSPVLCNLPSTKDMDLIYAVTNSASGLTYVYTNGVSRGTFTSGTFSSNMKVVGADNEASRVYYKGYIREMAYYSNIISAAQVAILHTYATNTYGYTP